MFAYFPVEENDPFDPIGSKFGDGMLEAFSQPGLRFRASAGQMLRRERR